MNPGTGARNGRLPAAGLRGRSLHRRTVPGLPLVAGAMIVVGTAAIAAAKLTAAPAYEPASTAARPEAERVHLDGVASVLAFDWTEDRLHLLDPLQHQVVALERGADGWRPVRTFGRYGGGPGEMMRPTGVAALPADGRVVVADQSRLHVFDAAGGYLESLPIDVPCVMPLPRVSAGRTGIFVHGDCLGRSAAGDTMHSLLFWTPDGRTYTEVAREVRYSADGRVGSILGAQFAFSPGAARHLFGTGTTNCVWEVRESEGAPTAVRLCELQPDVFPFRLRSESRQAMERRRMPLPLPGTHPYFLFLHAGGEPLLLRTYSEDSLVVRTLEGRRDLAVLGAHALVGCTRGGCLGAHAQADGVELELLPAAQLAALAGRTAP